MKLAGVKLLTVAALLSCAAVLSGCKDTTFENPPTDKVAMCDPQFVGKWRLLASDDKRNGEDAYYVIVERGCKRWRFIEDGKDDTKTEQTTHFSFARVGDQPLILIKTDPAKGSESDPQARWSNGYMYLRYEIMDKTIRLHPVDHTRIAHLIIDGAVEGRTERTSREPGSQANPSEDLHNFVAGGTQAMVRAVQQPGIFDETEFYTLKPAKDAEIFKPAKKPAKP